MRKIIKDLFFRLLGKSIKIKGIYSSWQIAKKHAGTYDSDLIINKVKESALKVKRGEASYERDSVLFYDKSYPFPLLAGLLRVAALNGGKLRVLDFGGSLGSVYFQCRDFLSGLKEVKWCNVEQEKFVVIGRNLFEDEELKFYFSIEECLQVESPDVIIFSSVLQYLEKPYEVLDKAIKHFNHIIIDRNPFSEIPDDLIAVQVVPDYIYKASFPFWIFSRKKFLDYLFKRGYRLIAEFPAVDGTLKYKNIKISFKGYIFDRLS